MPADPATAVVEGLEHVASAGFDWEVVVEAAPNPAADPAANRIAVGARGVELSGTSHPDGSGAVRLAYPPVFALDARTLVDGDRATAWIRVDVPALPPEAREALRSDVAAPGELGALAAALLDGWVAIEGATADFGHAARGGGWAEHRDEVVAEWQRMLDAHPAAPRVDVEALVADAEATFGTDPRAAIEPYLVATELAVDTADTAGVRRVDLALRLQQLLRDVTAVVARHVDLPADAAAELDRALATAPARLGGATATLEGAHVTALRFDLSDVLASFDATATHPLPDLAARVELSSIGAPSPVVAPDDVVATFDLTELRASVEALRSWAVPESDA